MTADEGEVITVRADNREKTLEDCSLSLVGRFHTTKNINFRAAKNLLRTVWKMGKDMTITEVGDGLFQFKFAMESQLKWVLNNGPWSFENHILLLRRWEKGMTAFSVSFETLPIWVQVWGLPFDLINEEAGRDIGRGVGRVIEVDCKAMAADQAKFLRIRVDMPLDKPIRRGAPVLSPEGDTVWVAFQYERLLGLCFRCGLLGHEARVCSASIGREGEELPYGDWLRAGFRRQREQSRKEAPSPPRRQPTDHQPSRTTKSPVVDPIGSVTSMARDINEGVTDSIKDFMEEIIPGVMTEGNPDNKEFPNGKELNRKEKNVGVNAEEFINIPIMYVGNMGNSGINSQSETLVPHVSEGAPCATLQAPRRKTPKWTKIPRVDSTNTTPPTGTIETGKKRSHEGEAQDGARKKSRAAAKTVESKTMEAEIQPRRAQ
ncbi:uncharacterized protein LOC126704737 [Quercus robur]|uniref:uncharacterized protein LOC126704737 n=1 Tax=Quercus robur TaxID=38942 RepID=UPI002162726B|nr:uncharacterized protein LOC126704737 [Quercus robur]